MLIQRFASVLFSLFIFSGVSASGEPLRVFSLTAVPSLSACAANWKVKSPLVRECEVAAVEAPGVFSLNSIDILHSWTYDSTLGWRLELNLFRTVTGYRMSVAASAGTPSEILEFSVAQKYLQSLLVDWGKSEIQQLIMSDQAAIPGLQYLGDVELARREVETQNEELIQHCLRVLRENLKKKSCIVHFAKYAQGEVALSHASIDSDAGDEKNKVSVRFAARSGWQELGPFSLAYFRLDYSGEFDGERIETLYRKALTQLSQPKFAFQVQKLAGVSGLPKFCAETSLKPAEVFKIRWQFDFDNCRRNWIYDAGHGRCKVSFKNPSWVLDRPGVRLSQSIKVKNSVLHLFLNVAADSYSLEVYGPQNPVGNFNNLSPSVQELLNRTDASVFTLNILR